MFIRIPDLDLLPIPDPGVNKAPDPGSEALLQIIGQLSLRSERNKISKNTKDMKIKSSYELFCYNYKIIFKRDIF
jgi:hypothetical protein